MRITFLGTGTSHGVPTIECMLDDYARCPAGVCRKAASDPRHRRTRASVVVEANGKHILIDTSQDFREQVLATRLPRVDAVLYTHAHADHIYGLPDIRSYCHVQRGPIEIYGSQETLAILRGSFDYSIIDLHSAGTMHIYPVLLEVDELSAISVTLDRYENAPTAHDLLPTFRDILAKKSLSITGEMTRAELEILTSALPGRGLAISARITDQLLWERAI